VLAHGDVRKIQKSGAWTFFSVLVRAGGGLAWSWWAMLLLRGLLPAVFAIAMGILVGAVHRGGAADGSAPVDVGYYCPASGALPVAPDDGGQSRAAEPRGIGSRDLGFRSGSYTCIRTSYISAGERCCGKTWTFIDCKGAPDDCPTTSQLSLHETALSATRSVVTSVGLNLGPSG
jgi:hypothetical protein